jgi:hypothetical protein
MSWPRDWNRTAMRRVAALEPKARRSVAYAGRMRDELTSAGEPELKSVATSPRSNHRRKATAEV